MQEAVLSDGSTLRGMKRKAEESNIASQAPKRIKVSMSEISQARPEPKSQLMSMSRLLIKMLSIKLLQAKS